jgi:hypothetical protein
MDGSNAAGSKSAFGQRKLDDVRRVALIHSGGSLALAAGHWRAPDPLIIPAAASAAASF